MRKGLALSLLVIGCSSSADVIEVTVPEAVSMVGLAEFDAQGRFVRGASLRPWTDSLSIVSPSGQETLLLGFTDEQLAAYGDVASPDDPLRLATDCSNRLPPAAFAAWWTPDGLRAVEPSMLPAFTNDAVTMTCPDVVDFDWAVDVTCFDELCAPVVSSLAPCTVQLDLSSCDGGQIVATVDSQGKVCATVERSDQCEAVEDEYSAQSFECASAGRSCPIHLYTDARERPRPFTITRGRWAVGENKRPGILNERAWIGLNHVRSGYAYAMTLLDDRVVVSGAVDADGCSELDSRLTFLDPETLDTISTSITYPCAQVLSTDPSGRTFVAVYYDDGWRAGRFSATGQELLRGPPIGREFDGKRLSGERQVPNWRPADILRPDISQALWLIMYDSRGAEPDLGTSAWIQLDASTLAPTASSEFLETWYRSYAGSLGPSLRYALVDDWTFSVGWFDPGQATPWSTVRIGRDTPLKNVYYDLRAISEDRMLVSLQGRAPAVTVMPDAQLQRMTHPAGEREQIMTSFLPWRGAIYLGIGIQTVNQGAREVVATLLDTANDRFLPGVWVIGEGMASTVQTDALGRHFIIFPWTAEIVRLDPI